MVTVCERERRGEREKRENRERKRENKKGAKTGVTPSLLQRIRTYTQSATIITTTDIETQLRCLIRKKIHTKEQQKRVKLSSFLFFSLFSAYPTTEKISHIRIRLSTPHLCSNVLARGPLIAAVAHPGKCLSRYVNWTLIGDVLTSVAASRGKFQTHLFCPFLTSLRLQALSASFLTHIPQP